MHDPSFIAIRDDRTETYLRNIRDNLNPQVQVVVIIFPTSRDDRYSAVKKLCCVESPVPSQVTLYVLFHAPSPYTLPGRGGVGEEAIIQGRRRGGGDI